MGRSVKINITLPGDELARIDQHVQEEKTTRSGLILKSLKSYIERKEEEVAEKKRRSAIRQAALNIKKLRAKSGRWNGVAEIRKWRDAR